MKRIIIVLSSLLIMSFVLLLSVVYIQYRDLKKVLVARLSAQVTSFIGQEVAIGDISIGPAGLIHLHSIAVRNPEGFAEGNLLKIQRLSMNLRYRELLKNHLSFESIVVQEPELSLIQNERGSLNISQKLKEFFQRKTALRYRIDEFTVKAGIVGFNNDEKFRAENMNMVVQDVTSEPGTKTLISAHTLYCDSRIDFIGWVFLNDEPKKMSMSILSRDISLMRLSEMLKKRYGMETEDTRMSILVKTEGDVKNGFIVSSDIGVRNAKFGFLNRGAKEVRLRLQAFLDIPAQKIVLDPFSLDAGGISSLTGKGNLKRVGHDIFYDGEMTVSMLDLSAISIMKDVKIGGIMNAERLLISGSSKKIIPELAGSIRLRDAMLQARGLNIGGLDADAQFRSVRNGHIDLTLRSITYGSYSLPRLHAKSAITYDAHAVRFDAPEITSPDFTASSRSVRVMLPQDMEKDAVRIDCDGVNVSYRDHVAGTRNTAITVTFRKLGDSFQGNADFTSDAASFKDFTLSFVKGSARFDDKIFSVDIAHAGMYGGTVRVAFGGKTTANVLPLKIMLSAEHLDVVALSRDMSQFTGMPYFSSGIIKRFSFEGTIHSIESAEGKGSIQVERLVIPDKDRRRNLLKDGFAKAEVAFKGKDLEFHAAAGAGEVAVNMTGIVNDFAEKKRAAHMQMVMPLTRVADIRETLWEVFPDGLLYAGLDGAFSSEIVVQFDDSSTRLNGRVVLDDVTLRGENGEFEVGPIKGIVPVEYRHGNHHADPGVAYNATMFPSFEPEEFQRLSSFYAKQPIDDTYSLLSVGKVSYGFEMLDNIKIWIRPEGKSLQVGHFSGNIFGGRMNGSATIELVEPVQYKAGFLVEGVSLTQLCDRIEPIRGYVSGKLDGIAMIKGAGSGLTGLIGKADFWTYSSSKEPTKISKEFLHKIGGPSLKRYLGDRKFDRGVMNLYLQKGYVIFRELEISNRNFFGIKDLDIRVAPLSNRISLDHLLWSITEAAYRAENK